LLLSKSSKHSNQSSVKSGFQSSVHDQYRSTAQAYDKSLLQKLDARRGSESITPPRKFANSAFGSASDASPTSRIALDHRHPVQLKALSLPIITSRPGLAESPLARWTETPTAISPGDPYPRPVTQVHDLRSPSDSADYDRRRRLINGSSNGSIASVGDDASGRSRDSYDQRISPDQDADFQMEETGFRRLHIGEYSGRPDPYSPGVTAGQKRRASSPPGDEGPPLHSAGSAGDLYRRREAAAMSSPSSRYQSLPGSISSTASGPRSNSYASTPSLGGSSITSMNSYGRLSPGGASPVPTDGSDSPYVTSLSLNPSPRGSMSRTNHGRALSDTRPLMTSRKLSDTALHSKQSTGPKLQGVFICECCPKKPKKFDSQEELKYFALIPQKYIVSNLKISAHEQEKQYECAYCRNRFKNKNEAERHQNSLHLRRHSWSCAALSGYAAAFHSSPTRPNEADACGYCGEEFLRSGVSSPSQGRHQVAVVTEQDWEIRVVHLQEMHKFRECNHAKKFFRADHFRQHLKHSHAGTSGKWTNMLENACMKDEPLPEPIRGRERVGPGNARVARINEEEEIL
jgi:hypothetical protein